MGRTPATVVPVKNPLALSIPEVHGLFVRAFTNGGLSAGWSDQVMAELISMIGNPNNGFWIGEERGVYKALLIVLLPSSFLNPIPIVYMIYNEGSRSLLKQIANAGIAFLRANGYSRFRGINMNMTDDQFAKVFKFAGKSVKTMSVMEFEISG